jgi:hypothetical protein
VIDLKPGDRVRHVASTAVHVVETIGPDWFVVRCNSGWPQFVTETFFENWSKVDTDKEGILKNLPAPLSICIDDGTNIFRTKVLVKPDYTWEFMS